MRFKVDVQVTYKGSTTLHVHATDHESAIKMVEAMDVPEMDVLEESSMEVIGVTAVIG